MKSKLNLLKEFPTRKPTGFLDSIYKALPDPDKILEENNYDFEFTEIWVLLQLIFLLSNFRILFYSSLYTL